MYTISISNANWTGTITVTYTPGAAAPNAQYIDPSGNLYSYNATSIGNAVDQAVNRIMGISCGRSSSGKGVASAQ